MKLSKLAKIIGLFFVALLIIKSSYAETYLVTINNPNGYNLANYQVRIDLSSYLTTASNLKVTDASGNVLSFCYEQSNGECSTTPTTTIWVKVPSIPAGGSTDIYIYTDQATNYATTGDNVFDFYDDFNDGTIDSNKWTIGQGTYSESNGLLCLTSSASSGVTYIYSTVTFTYPFRVELYGRIGTNEEGNILVVTSDLAFSAGSYASIGYTSTISTNFIMRAFESVGTETTTFVNDGNFHLFRIDIDTNAYPTHYIDGNQYIHSSRGANTNPLYILPIETWVASGTFSTYCADWVRVRKYADVEPTINIQIIGMSVSITNEQQNSFVSKLNVTVQIDNSHAQDINTTIYYLLNDSVVYSKQMVLPANSITTDVYVYEILKEGTYNITVKVYDPILNKNVTDYFIVTFDLYDENVTYDNYTIYNNTKYVDTLAYKLQVRCGALGYNITVLANLTDANKTYAIQCDNTTKIIEDSFRFSSEGTKQVWFYLNAVNSSDSRYFGNNSFVVDLNPPEKIEITLTDYLGIYRNNKAIPTNFTIYVYDNISPILECKILRKLTDINDGNYVIANNLTDTLNTNSSKTYSYTFSETNINYYEDYIEVECKDLVNHTSKNTLSKYFIRQDFNFVDELLKTITNYNRTYAVYNANGTTFLQLSESQTVNSITIITDTNATWFSISTEYNNGILTQDFELSLTSKYYNEINVCVPSSNQQYIIKHLIASEPYPEYLLTVFNPDSGCFVTSSNLKYYSQNVYYLPIPSILNQKYAISIQNVYVASITGSDTPVDVSLLIQKLIQLQNVVKNMFLSYEYNITHEITNTSVRLYIKTERTISDILVELWRANQKLGVITIDEVNNNTAVVSILKSQYDNFELNETKNEYVRINIKFDDGFSINTIYPSSPYGQTLPTILAWILAVLFALYFFATKGHYIKTIYASVGLVILSIVLVVLSESYAPIVFTTALFLSYLLDVAYSVLIPEEIKKDIVVALASPLVKITLASIFVSTIITSMNLPTELPFSSDIDKIRESIEKVSLQIENMLSSPLQTILTIVNVVLTAFTLLWYSIKLTMSLILYTLDVLVGGILPVTAIATTISIILIFMFIIAIIRALILARTQ